MDLTNQPPAAVAATRVARSKRGVGLGKKIQAALILLDDACLSRPIACAEAWNGATQFDQFEKFHPRSGVVPKRAEHGAGDRE
jgi:hypothetical protein